MTLTANRSDVSNAKLRQLNDLIPLRVTLGLGVLWGVLLALVFSIAPAPVDDPSVLAVTVSVLFELGLVATLAGLVAMRRWGLLASMGAAVVMLSAAALCSLGGHTGAWLVAQYVAAAALFTVSRAAFRQT